jgi:hypothetical protein
MRNSETMLQFKYHIHVYLRNLYLLGYFYKLLLWHGSTVVWRWYTNVTIIILEFIHRAFFYLKHDVSENEFCICPQVEPIQMGPQ